jgi:ribosomal protein S17E
MNYTYCSHGNYWHMCSDQECADLGHVTTAVCEYCKLKDVRTEATMNKRGYELCQKCYDSQAKAERESDEFNEQFYKNQAIVKEATQLSCKKTIVREVLFNHIITHGYIPKADELANALVNALKL